MSVSRSVGVCVLYVYVLCQVVCPSLSVFLSVSLSLCPFIVCVSVLYLFVCPSLCVCLSLSLARSFVCKSPFFLGLSYSLALPSLSLSRLYVIVSASAYRALWFNQLVLFCHPFTGAEASW